MLTEAVTSALKQNYPRLEVIVSDDASTDNTKELIQQFTQDSRFRYFRNSENLGLVPNLRKVCFEYASGDWLLILNDDDYLIDPHYVSKAMDLLSQDSEIVVIHSNCRVLVTTDRTTTDTDKSLPVIADGKWMFLNYKYAYFGNINCSTLTVIFNRHLAMSLGCFQDDTIPISNDRETWLKLLLRGKVGFLSDVSAVYRIHGGNLHRHADMNILFANLGSILNPYEFAKLEGCFHTNELEQWKKRMIREACEIWLISNLITCRHKISLLSQFIRRISIEYPFALISVLKVFMPETLAKIVLSAFNNVIHYPEA
jgi:glycosyltransferase involved in cell wall biosynthesis